MIRKPIAIDLFCGAGGLTVGLKRAGISIACAVEVDKNACDTYKANHHDVHLVNRDICQISNEEFLSLAKKYKINMVVGCPPCQGFSSLTNNQDDPRNKLVNEFIRVIQIMRPSVVMMENVPGIITKGKPHFNQLIEMLENLEYTITYSVLQVADYGVPQSRRRLVLIASRDKKINLPLPSHSSAGDGLPKWVTVKKIFEQTKFLLPMTSNDLAFYKDPNLVNWHIIRQLAPINKERLKYLKPGASRYSIPDHLRPKCHQGKNKGYGNVYARMNIDQPSPTITSGCTTMSTGRFVHPFEDRTISVREAALLQTFPLDYIFKSRSIESVCRLIGNALPCDFAFELGKNIMIEIGAYNE